MALKRVSFLDSGPLIVNFRWMPISFRTASLSESSFLFFTSSQILLMPTTIEWLGLPISSITKLLRVLMAISKSAVSISSSGISSASIPLLSSAAVWRENRLLICCALLHSFGIKHGLSVFISEGLHLHRYLHRISLVSSSFTLFEFLHQESLDVNLVGRFVTFRAHPNCLASYLLAALWLFSPWVEVDGTSGADVIPVTFLAHFLLTRSYMDSQSTSRRCLPVSIWLSVSDWVLNVRTYPVSWQG